MYLLASSTEQWAKNSKLVQKVCQYTSGFKQITSITAIHTAYGPFEAALKKMLILTFEENSAASF